MPRGRRAGVGDDDWKGAVPGRITQLVKAMPRDKTDRPRDTHAASILRKDTPGFVDDRMAGGGDLGGAAGPQPSTIFATRMSVYFCRWPQRVFERPWLRRLSP